jgi:hypothetical protein
MRLLTSAICLFLLTAIACKSEPNSHAEAKPPERALRLSVTTAPEQPRMDKSFTVRAHLLNAEGGPVTGAKLMGLLTMKAMDHGNLQFEFTEKGHGVYEGISKVEMSGDWNLKLTAEHEQNRLEQDFPLAVGD